METDGPEMGVGALRRGDLRAESRRRRLRRRRAASAAAAAQLRDTSVLVVGAVGVGGRRRRDAGVQRPTGRRPRPAHRQVGGVATSVRRRDVPSLLFGTGLRVEAVAGAPPARRRRRGTLLLDRRRLRDGPGGARRRRPPLLPEPALHARRRRRSGVVAGRRRAVADAVPGRRDRHLVRRRRLAAVRRAHLEQNTLGPRSSISFLTAVLAL